MYARSATRNAAINGTTCPAVRSSILTMLIGASPLSFPAAGEMLFIASQSVLSSAYWQMSQMPWLLRLEARRVPSYFMPHFCITLPEFGFLVSCRASTRFRPTLPSRKSVTALSASGMMPRCHQFLPRQ